jgi:hypothetical protein
MIRWLTGRWCPLYRIVENAFGRRWNDFCKPDGPGVYRLVALDSSKSGIVPAPLERVCGTDPTGTLYIGRSESLRNRLSSLVRSQNPTKILGGDHIPVSGKLAKRFPRQWLAITWQRTNSGDCRMREATLFGHYMARFGELPPMNGQG